VIISSSKTEIKNYSYIDEFSGKLKLSGMNDKLMHSVLENDKETIEHGKIISESINQGLNSFTPDLMFEQIIRNYSIAKKLYGHKLLRLLCGYNSDYIEKNIRIPEFQRELQKKIQENIEQLQQRKLINNQGEILEKGLSLASLVLYIEELDNLIPKGMLGERIHKKSFIYGDKEDIKQYKKHDRYRDIAIKKSLKLAIKRNHKQLRKEDLRSFEKQSRGQIFVIYALDASGSMKGKKIGTCKKAGIALAYKAINEKDKVGLIVFGSDVRKEIKPTLDFGLLLKSITNIKALKETNIALTIKKSIELFPASEVTKHLILITDAMPTIGKEPEIETLEAVSLAKLNEITISLIGIKLDEKGKNLAERITQLGGGKFYIVKNLEDLDKIVLEDYYSTV
jgi:Mg-chelatase subunit ChlD